MSTDRRAMARVGKRPASALDRSILRFAIGVTLGVGVSQAVGWPAAFIAPVFCALLLQAPRAPTVRDAAELMLVLSGALLVGYLIAAWLLPYPLLCASILTALYFYTFFRAKSGASPFFVVLTLLGISVMPIVGLSSLSGAQTLAGGLLASVLAALAISWFMFMVIPTAAAPEKQSVAQHPAPLEERVSAASTMTAVIAPLALGFLIFGWTSLLILIMSAMLVQQLSLSATVKSGLGMLAANMAGGLIAVTVYYALVAVPVLLFLVLIILFLGLWFGRRMFSGRPEAGLWGSAFTAAIILIGGSVAPFGADADAKFLTRIAQFALAVGYVAAAFLVLDALRGLLHRLRRSGHVEPAR